MEARTIDSFILNNVEAYPGDIVKVTMKKFGISRQSGIRHMRELIAQGSVVATGQTKAREYKLRWLVEESFSLNVSGMEEDRVWREKVLPLVQGVENNVLRICQYGFTEMLNNVIDHSESDIVTISIYRNAILIKMVIADHGVGIFNKIQKAFNLNDPRHALLELSKGKLTTDKSGHTGEGVFFTSRMFDEFSIYSGMLYFNRVNEADDSWLIEVEDRDQYNGTIIYLKISPEAKRTTSEIFNKAESGELTDFSRTHVPVKLARYGNEQLVSRSQAKRVLARFEGFKEIDLDFKDVAEIGPAFADEIFRVFRFSHPEIKIFALRTTPEVQKIIDRVPQIPEYDPNQLNLFTSSNESPPLF